ncbi:MAG: flagellar biosynthesis protein FlhA [Thermaerobacter sp.]|nr:flagellar biosynthesis protein FlhA [Thermaerobacter sp.]
MMRLGQSGTVVFVLVIMTMLIIPLPTFMIDALILVNLAFALLILLVTLNMKDPLEFSAFPALLLLTTLFRLALNVSSTRLILLQANAGTVISTFGNFVVGGNAVVGFIVFLILVIVQFIVITRGAERVSEVAARFTLDAMPGKQMSIDADLNAGLISDTQARQRRKLIAAEADFYGAMDGASKFVRGDAIASMLIVGINIIGGFVIGMLFLHLGALQSLQTYTVLSVGDGLVSQLPALLISTATGLLVTRAASEAHFGGDLVRQLLQTPRTLYVLAAVIAFLGIFTPISKLVALVLAAGFALLGYRASQGQEELATAGGGIAGADVSRQQAAPGAPAEAQSGLAPVDALSVEFGFGLLSLVDKAQGGDFFERVQKVREQVAEEMGLWLPPVRVKDNLSLPPNNYRVLLRGAEVARGELMPGRLLAMGQEGHVPGIATRDPAFGLPALWIARQHQDQAVLQGYTVIDTATVLTTHFAETVRRHAHELLSREDAKRTLDRLRQVDPAAVDELVPGLLPLSTVHRVLQGLLREGIPVRDLVTIVETLGDRASETKDADQLTEYVRQALGRTISQAIAPPGEALVAVTLDPRLEAELRARVQTQDGKTFLALDQDTALKLSRSAEQLVRDPARSQEHIAIVVAPQLRSHLRRLLRPVMEDVPILSYQELDPGLKLQSGGVIRIDDERGAVQGS